MKDKLEARAPRPRHRARDKAKVTINDIARLANVSKKTVSRVINDSPLVRDETRQKVKLIISEHGFAPTTTYELVRDERRYPPKAILGTAYEFATGQRLGSGDFEGWKGGAVDVLGNLGFSIQRKQPAK